jgi:hypothetical protein
MNKIVNSIEIFPVLSEREQKKNDIKNMLLSITEQKYLDYYIYTDNSALDASIQAEKKEKDAIIAFFSEEQESPIDPKYIENIKRILILKRDARKIAKGVAETLENAGQEIKTSLDKRKQGAEMDMDLFNELIDSCCSEK